MEPEEFTLENCGVWLMIRYRKAEWDDVRSLLELYEKGFSTRQNSVDYQFGKEHRVLFSYLYSLETWKPEYVVVAEEGRQIIAAVGAFPQKLAFDGRYVPVWSISPVVTHPEHRGRRAAVHCLEFLFEELIKSRIYAAFLWGIPDYYPKLGFVPVLPRYKTKLSQKQIRGGNFERHAGSFREASPDDSQCLRNLYDQNEKQLWLQPKRDLAWWDRRISEWDKDDAFNKEVPFPKKEYFKVWENNSGEIGGYLNFSPDEKSKRVSITEAAAQNMSIAQSMVEKFVKEMAPDYTLIIRGTPDHLLNNAAYNLGGNHLNPAPLAGMVKVLNWPRFLNELLPLFNSRLSGLALTKHLNLEYQVENCKINMDLSSSGLQFELPEYWGMELNRKFTRLIFGLSDQDCLEGFTDLRDDLILELLLPRKYPFIWDNNYLY